MNKNPAIGHSWEDVRSCLFTQEEIAQSDFRVEIIGEIIKARKENGITQKRLEELSGVRQPVIARMENGTSKPTLETLLKVLSALGMTLKVVPTTKKTV